MSQTDELAFLAKIRETPDDDTPRLVFADWLDEHRRHAQAELIRVSCELDPIRDQLGSERFETLRICEWQLEDEVRRSFQPFFDQLLGKPGADVEFGLRKGCIETVSLPLPWFLHKGEHVLSAIPSIRRADLFRVTGWGERTAQCPALSSLEEMEIVGWDQNDDLLALLQSPYLKSLRMLRFWPSIFEDRLRATMEQGWRTDLVPCLEELQIVWGNDNHWKNWPHSHRMRTINPYERPYRFGSGGNGLMERFFPGWLPDNHQMMALLTEDWNQMNIEVFDRAGRIVRCTSIDLPDHLTHRTALHEGPENVNALRQLLRDITVHLRSTIGYRPGLIALRDRPCTVVDVYTDDLPDWFTEHLESPEPPLLSVDSFFEADRGLARPPYDWITRECFTFHQNDRFSWRVDGIRGEATPM